MPGRVCYKSSDDVDLSMLRDLEKPITKTERLKVKKQTYVMVVECINGSLNGQAKNSNTEKAFSRNTVQTTRFSSRSNESSDR